MRTDVPLYTAEVVSRAVITPNMLRISLGGARTAEGVPFESSGRSDEFFGLWLRDSEGREVKRYYTVRAWDRASGRLDIDFVVHAHGPATGWAREAVVGDQVAFDAPRGHYAPPTGVERVLLVGDATALPAIGRILEERAPHDAPVSAILTVDDPVDRQRLPFREGDEVRWVPAQEMLAETVTATAAFDASSYLWFSGESSLMRQIRRHVRHTLGWPRSRYMTMGYWRRDEERWAAEFARHPGLEQRIAAIWDNGGDDETQRDMVDDLLARNGL
ncbi:siderophore-interacting protein [Microbacterium paraoxydans]|uniref:siderophore-interacting protein n=1 Tax=Microbacterium paraoxydans TaxID=199592 RepID=UPI001CF98A3C|nr:siderophore-interacting protein [Microbacterium paraoxydans]